MDHDDLPIGTFFSRRELLHWALVTGAVAALPSWVTAQTHHSGTLVACPELEEGPFFVDEHLFRANLLKGTTRKAVTDGTPLRLNLEVHKLTGKTVAPLPGAHIDIWCCDTTGAYSDEPGGMNGEDTKGQRWLRGYQVSDAKGHVHFDTIVPGWYPARTTHIHFKIRKYSEKINKSAVLTSQLFFDPKQIQEIYAKPPYASRGMPRVSNADDNVYNVPGANGKPSGLLNMIHLSEHGEGHTATLKILLTDQNFNTRVRERMGGPGGPGGPPPDDFGWEYF